MRTKNIFKTVALAMLMPAMLLTSACSNQDDVVNNTAENTVTNKGYALPVTVNVTRQADGTRATFDGSKLNFGAGDKLFVEGKYATGSKSFAGALDYVSEGTFSGTIYAQDNTYSTYDALLTAASSVTATLLPNYYESTGFLSINNNSTTDIAYDDRVSVLGSYAFVASETAKATGVEQLSLERASTYSSGFALAPGNAILNFTITGLEAGAKDVLLHIHHGFDYDVTGSVTPNASGVATFAIGVPVGANIKEMSNNLTVGSSNFTLPSSTTFAVGKIYNITRSAAIPGALNGQFSVASGKKVYFSKGNLQAKIASYASNSATASEWKFADSQYSTIGNAAGNTTFATGTWVDLFSWVGNSATNDTYGLITFNTSTKANHGNVSGESLKTDWGTAAASSIGTGWRTLTKNEWVYLFNTRTVNSGKGKGKSYTVGQSVNGKLGVVLYPDNYTGAVYSGSDWATFESAGCVFLPAAGSRSSGTSVSLVGSNGYYWSGTANGTGNAYRVSFYSDGGDPQNSTGRYYGCSVRLVHDAN